MGGELRAGRTDAGNAAASPAGASPASASPVATWVVAYLLWFFLGMFGAHRLYLKRTLSGNLYLATLGLFGLGWLADSVLTAFLVRGRLAERSAGAKSFEREAMREIESLETGQHARSPGREGEPNLASEFLDFGASTLFFVLSSAALAYMFVAFDLALMCFPIAVVWIVLLIDGRAIDRLKDNFFIIKDLPVNVENTLSATVFKNFHFRKGYRISAAKYVVYPLYLLAYPFLARRMDRKRAELTELYMFFRLYTGIFLFWLTIELSRYFSQAASLGHPAIASVLCLHPIVLALGLWKGWYAASSLGALLPESAGLLALTAYFAQISNSLIVRNQYDMTVSRSERSFAPVFRFIVIALIAAFSLIGFGAVFSSRARAALEGLSPRKFAAAVDYAYQREALEGLLDQHVLAPENGLLLYESLLSSLKLAGADGRAFSRSAAWAQASAAWMKVFRSDLPRFVDPRFLSFYHLYPVLFDDSGGNRHCYFVYAVDDTGQGLGGTRKIYPLLILEGGLEEPAAGGAGPERGAVLDYFIIPPQGLKASLEARGAKAPAGDAKPGSDPAGGGSAGSSPGQAGSGTAAGAGNAANVSELQSDIVDARFLKELEEGFRRYFLDAGMGVDSFKVVLDRFLDKAPKGVPDVRP